MKKILVFLVLCAAIGGGTFLYMTRPVSAPSGASPVASAPVVPEKAPEGDYSIFYRCDPVGGKIGDRGSSQ